jgi:pimeloyl-ACP methyl ester carboxylesterase
MCAFAVVLFCLGHDAAAQSTPWIRKSSQNHGVIVFVHGLMGDSRNTWSSGNAYWPEMLTHDHRFDGQDIYVYHYASPPFHQAFSIDQLVENMRLLLRTDGVLSYDEITFVSHSMGGIVTRAFILRNRDEVARKIRLLYFFATPTTGNSFAQVAKLFSDNPQFKALLSMNDPNSFLASQQSEWVDAKLSLRSYCGYETQGVHGRIVVERDSATNLCSGHIDPIDADHIDIVKPKDTDSTPYRALVGAFMETAKPTPNLPRHASKPPSIALNSPKPTSPAPTSSASIPPEVGAISPAPVPTPTPTLAQHQATEPPKDDAYTNLGKAMDALSRVAGDWISGISQDGQFLERGQREAAGEQRDAATTNKELQGLRDLHVARLTQLSDQVNQEWPQSRTLITSAFNMAISRMKLPGSHQISPNDEKKERDNFEAALREADRADMNFDQPRIKRFVPLAEYLKGLKLKLGDYPENL